MYESATHITSKVGIRVYLMVFMILVPLMVYGCGGGLKAVGRAATAPPPENVGCSYALLIGVSDYEQWPDLKNVPREIDAVEKALYGQGFMVDKVIDPDSDEMHYALRRFIDTHGLEEENRLLIFFSGHGYTHPRKDEDYLLPTDAPVPYPWEKRKGYMAIKQKAVSMAEIRYLAKRADAKHLLIVFDSYFSGSMGK